MVVLVFCQMFSEQTHTFVYDSLNEVRNLGVEVHVVTFRRVNEHSRPFENVHVVIRPSKWNPLRLGYRTLAGLGWGEVFTSDWEMIRYRLSEVVQRVRPDLIHAHFGPAGALIAPVCEQLSIPLVVTFHGYDVSRLPRLDAWQRLYRMLFDKASCLVGVSSHVAEKLSHIAGTDLEKITVIHNGVDFQKFAGHELAAASVNPVRCLFVGRLVEKKDPLGLLEAFRKSLKRVCRKELHLTIVGKGPLRGKVNTKIRDLGIEQHVKVIEEASHRKVADMMSKSDIYVQCCRTASDGDQEGLGMTLLEASAAGLPIVSTSHSGIQDAVRHEDTALLAPEGNHDITARFIVRLAENPGVRLELGRNGRNFVQENFSLGAHASQLIKLYRKTCTG